MSVLKAIIYLLAKLYVKSLDTRHVFTFLLLLVNLVLPAQAPSSQEHQVKAVFLFNFTQFVEWPANTFSTTEMPMVIGVLGKNPFGNYLKDVVSDEKVNNHPLIVQYYNTIEEIKTCHILFINFSETDKLEEAVASLNGKSILTVSDVSGFLKHGGMIRFFTKNDKIQLQINPEAVKAADLTLSSKLLRLAEIVVPKNN